MAITNLKLKLLPFPSLSTKRLELVPLSLIDIRELYELRSDPKIAELLDRSIINSEKEAEAFMNKIINGVNAGKWVYWKIQLKGTIVLIGTICLWMFNEDGYSCDVGYELRKKYCGNGYMNEAVDVVVDYGFDHLDLKSIKAYTAEKNEASTRLLKRCGFEQVDQEEKNLIFIKRR